MANIQDVNDAEHKLKGLVFIPSDALQQELLRTPGMVRLATTADGAPAIVLKADSLALKYLTQGNQVRLVVFDAGPGVAYACEIKDGHVPAFAWSLMESAEERDALIAIANGTACEIHLFNEAVTNVSSATCAAQPTSLGPLSSLPLDPRADPDSVEGRLDELVRGPVPTFVYEWLAFKRLVWSPLTSVLLTASGKSSTLNMLDPDEGSQQEQLGLWLTDHLNSGEVFLNPTVHLDDGQRELCDILLGGDDGPIVVESKALALLGRATLPPREELSRQTPKQIRKAIRQLAGALRAIRSGAAISDRDGRPIVVERRAPAHAIVLLSDLDLVPLDVHVSVIQEGLGFLARHGAFLQVMDPSALIRTSQAAAILATNSEHTPPMRAFDAWLLERWRTVLHDERLDVDLVLDLKASE